MSFPDGARLSKWLIFKYARIEVAPYLSVVNFNGSGHCCMTPLTAVQMRILALIGFSAETYQGLELLSGKLGAKMGEP